MPIPAFESCCSFLENLHSERYFTAASFGIAHPLLLLTRSIGFLDDPPRSIPVTPATLFDIASITKPVATATAILQLFESGRIDLEEQADTFLPEFRETGLHRVTVKQLLTHTAGLAAWKPLYLKGSSVQEYIEQIAADPLDYKPGTRVVYSCLGYIALAEIVRRVTGRSLQSYCDSHIFTPLGMMDTCFNPPHNRRHRIAPVELGNAYERFLTGSAGADYSRWRNERIRGEVHDNNGFQAGGETGNSGLFSSTHDLIVFGLCILDGLNGRDTPILRSETIRYACRNHTEGLDFGRGLGWQIASTSFSAGSLISRDAIGHNGFTGTSIWIDRHRLSVVVLLTNRTYFGGDPARFSAIRAPFHDRAVECVDRLSAQPGVTPRKD